MWNVIKSIVLLNLLSADGNNAKLYKQTKQILTFELLVLKEIKIKTMQYKLETRLTNQNEINKYETNINNEIKKQPLLNDCLKIY